MWDEMVLEIAAQMSALEWDLHYREKYRPYKPVWELYHPVVGACQMEAEDGDL